MKYFDTETIEELQKYPDTDRCLMLADTLARKNADYDRAFDRTIDEFGMVAVAIRLTDKLNRFKHLLNDDAKVDESIEDTLMDLAGYAVLAVNYMTRHDKSAVSE